MLGNGLVRTSTARLRFALAATIAAAGFAFVFALMSDRAHGATALGQVAPAGAITEGCVPGFNLVQNSSTGPDYAIPAGGGVITGWSHAGLATGVARGVEGDLPGFGRLLIWEPISGAEHRLVGGSEVEAFSFGLNTFDVRIPVTGGELLGLRTSAEAVTCVHLGHAAADVASAEGGGATDPQPGEARFLDDVSEGGARVNIAASLEPDADGDGYGDESQDVTIELKLKNKLKAKRKGFPVKLTCGGTECDAEIKGKASARTKGGSSASAAKRITYKLKTKTISVGAGETKKTKVKMKRHKKSQKKLAKLLKSSSKGSKLKLNATAENPLGSSDKVKDKAKLKG